MKNQVLKFLKYALWELHRSTDYWPTKAPYRWQPSFNLAFWVNSYSSLNLFHVWKQKKNILFMHIWTVPCYVFPSNLYKTGFFFYLVIYSTWNIWVSPGIFHKDCFSEQVHILSFCILWGLSGISSALRIDQILQTSYSYWISKRNRYGISYVFYPWLR